VTIALISIPAIRLKIKMPTFAWTENILTMRRAGLVSGEKEQTRSITLKYISRKKGT